MMSKFKGLRSPPGLVQLPGGVTLKGLPFKILEYNADGSPKTFELLPPDFKSDCVLYADEAWIRSPAPK